MTKDRHIDLLINFIKVQFSFGVLLAGLSKIFRINEDIIALLQIEYCFIDVTFFQEQITYIKERGNKDLVISL